MTKKSDLKSVPDLLMKDGPLTPKESQRLADLTSPTAILKDNGIYTNGEEHPDFQDSVDAQEPAKSTKTDQKRYAKKVAHRKATQEGPAQGVLDNDNDAADIEPEEVAEANNNADPDLKDPVTKAEPEKKAEAKDKKENS